MRRTLPLYVSDGYNSRLRSVDVKTRTVKTICGDGQNWDRDGVAIDSSLAFSFDMCLDRSSLSKPESGIFFSTHGSLRRFEIESGKCIAI